MISIALEGASRTLIPSFLQLDMQSCLCSAKREQNFEGASAASFALLAGTVYLNVDFARTAKLEI